MCVNGCCKLTMYNIYSEFTYRNTGNRVGNNDKPAFALRNGLQRSIAIEDAAVRTAGNKQ